MIAVWNKGSVIYVYYKDMKCDWSPDASSPAKGWSSSGVVLGYIRQLQIQDRYYRVIIESGF